MIAESECESCTQVHVVVLTILGLSFHLEGSNTVYIFENELCLCFLCVIVPYRRKVVQLEYCFMVRGEDEFCISDVSACSRK